MGALGGHMAHLSEDLDLTFNEIVEVLGKVANAEIEAVTEKVDGQNLFLTVTESGDIRAARNNIDVAAGGMTTEEYASKWRGHPAESAFTNGFKAISTALRKLSPETLEDVFADGDRYVNMEIMYPKNPNIILYSAPQVVLHALRYMGGESAEDLTAEEREELNRLQKVANEKFPALVKAVDGAEEQIGEELWTINGPKLVALKKLADGTALAEVAAKIEAFASPVGMDAQLKDYVELVVRKYADQVGLPEDRVDNLLLLMLDREKAEEKGITVNVVKKGLPKELKPVVSKLATITNARKYISTILHPVEVAISDFAIEVLRGVKSFFVDEHDKEVIRMRNELEKSIIYLKGLQDSGDVKMGELMDKQLAKLGDIENLASTMEGVVFEYPPGSGNTYKLTGAFAMANQIIGRARRSGMNEDLSGEFTINISSDRTMTKSLAEWLEEIESAEHSYTKLPQTVYEDILSGGMIVDIVEQENALPTVYNTVLTYVNSLREEEEVDVEVVEPPKTIAIVPGAFKPPHLGHLAMVEQYAAMADEANRARGDVFTPQFGRKVGDGAIEKIGDALRIRAAENAAATLDQIAQAALQFRAVGAALGKSAAIDGERADAKRLTGLDNGTNGFCRHRQDRHVRHFRQSVDSRVARQAIDLTMPGVNRKYPALKTVALEIGDRPAANPAKVGRRADDRHGTGV